MGATEAFNRPKIISNVFGTGKVDRVQHLNNINVVVVRIRFLSELEEARKTAFWPLFFLKHNNLLVRSSRLVDVFVLLACHGDIRHLCHLMMTTRIRVFTSFYGLFL